MRGEQHETAGGAPRRAGADIRLRGFSERAAMGEAIAWIDSHAPHPVIEEIALAEAAGRILLAPLAAPLALPTERRAAIDGYALRAADTVGSSDYNPLPLTLGAATATLPPGGAALIAAGTAPPVGADAILSFAAAQRTGAGIEVSAAVGMGTGIEPAGALIAAGAPLFAARHRLRPQDIGLLAALGIERLSVARAPRIALVVAGPKASAAVMPDANGPMLRALVARDGGIAGERHLAATREAIAAVLMGTEAEAILVAGRSGAGEDDEAALALAAAGDLAIHGVALRPGGSLGVGIARGMPVVLLPGDPLACLTAYDLFAGRLIRRMAGRAPPLPYPARSVATARKIVSTIGTVDLCRVRLVEGRADPIGSAESGGLVSAARADGFVLVPEALEGYAPGASVTVYLYAGGADAPAG